MFITLYATAVALLVVGVLWAEIRLNGRYYTDNALTWAQEAYEDWWWTRHDRAQNAARMAARLEAAE